MQGIQQCVMGLIVSLLITTIGWGAPPKPARDTEMEKKDGQLHMLGATWKCGNKRVNATDRVQLHLNNGRLEFDVTTKEFGDIGAGPKELVLNYVLDGTLVIGHYKEGEHVSIAAPNAPPLPPVPPKPAAGTTEQPDFSPDSLQPLHDLAKNAGKNVHASPFGVLIDGEGEIRTGNKLSLPVKIDVIASTDSTDIRLLFGDKGVVIFNWQDNQNELRYHHPDSHVLWTGTDKGHVPTNQWVHIVWIIEPTRGTVIVDGETRAVIDGHYIGLSGTAGVASYRGKVQVCQLNFREMAPALNSDSPITQIARAQSSIKSLFVTHAESGEMLGLAQDLILTATRGTPATATPVSFATPVGNQMQGVLEDVLRVVRIKYPNWGATKVDLSFEERSTSKDGGSIGAAIGTLLLSMLTGFDVDPQLAMTGDVTADGKVRPIGGVAAKLRGAEAADCTIVAVPAANLDQLMDAVIYEGPGVVTDVQVIGLSKLDDAVAVARTDRDAKLAEAIQTFASLQPILKKFPDRVRTKDTQDKLAHILDLAPNHLSAKVLLMIAQNKLPRKMSASASMYYAFVSVNTMTPTLFDRAKTVDTKQVTPAVVQTGLRNLRKLRGHADPKVLPLIDAWSDFIDTVNAVETHKKPPQILDAKRQALLDAMTKVNADRALMEKMLHEGV